MRPLVQPFVTALAFLVMLSGCYTGHAVKLDALRTITNDSEPGTAELETAEGEPVEVGPDTVVVVRDLDGLRHPIQAFTFKLSATQLVAPEQDLILGLDTIDSYEVRKISTVKTFGMVGLGVVTAGAMAASILLTAGDSSFSN